MLIMLLLAYLATVSVAVAAKADASFRDGWADALDIPSFGVRCMYVLGKLRGAALYTHTHTATLQTGVLSTNRT